MEGPDDLTPKNCILYYVTITLVTWFLFLQNLNFWKGKMIYIYVTWSEYVFTVLQSKFQVC